MEELDTNFLAFALIVLVMQPVILISALIYLVASREK